MPVSRDSPRRSSPLRLSSPPGRDRCSTTTPSASRHCLALSLYASRAPPDFSARTSDDATTHRHPSGTATFVTRSGSNSMRRACPASPNRHAAWSIPPPSSPTKRSARAISAASSRRGTSVRPAPASPHPALARATSAPSAPTPAPAAPAPAPPTPTPFARSSANALATTSADEDDSPAAIGTSPLTVPSMPRSSRSPLSSSPRAADRT